MPNLLLHCGGQAIERAELDRHPTPSPTGSWQPVPHATLLDLVERAFAHAGMNVVDQAHALGRDGDRYFGLMHLSVDRGNYDHDEAQDTTGNGYGFIAGLRNSHDRSFPASLVLGSVVFVCDNLAFSGEVVLARRHTPATSSATFPNSSIGRWVVSANSASIRTAGSRRTARRR